MKRRIIGYLSQCAWANKLEKYLEKIKINKKGTTLYQVGHIFVQDFERNDIIERAGGVAFSFTLAVFPAIIFMITLIPYIQQFYPEFSEANIMGFFQDVMPPSVFDAASTTIEDILGHKRGGLLSLGAILAFYLSTNGMMSLIKAFNRCYRTKDNRGYIKTFLIATFLTMILAFTLFIAVILLIIGQTVLEKFRDLGFLTQDYLFYSIVTSRFIVIVVIFFLSISLIFHFAPAVHDRWKMFSPGAFLATLLSLMVSYTFSFYISNFGTYNKLYGSIGAMIAFMVWLFLISVIILTGFELNASIDKANKINQERVHADKL
jgi:membrane protein